MTAGPADVAAAATGTPGPAGAMRRERGSRSHGWPLVVCYAAVAGASQLLWLTYAPVATAAAEHYGVSVSAIGWLANVFPLLYVELVVPAGIALDRDPRRALAFGVVLTALGGVVRLGGCRVRLGAGWPAAGGSRAAIRAQCHHRGGRRPATPVTSDRHRGRLGGAVPGHGASARSGCRRRRR